MDKTARSVVAAGALISRGTHRRDATVRAANAPSLELSSSSSTSGADFASVTGSSDPSTRTDATCRRTKSAVSALDAL
eukprot:scaffold2791_cov154-Amphora_coffeaeformis.AAC.16